MSLDRVGQLISPRRHYLEVHLRFRLEGAARQKLDEWKADERRVGGR